MQAGNEGGIPNGTTPGGVPNGTTPGGVPVGTTPGGTEDGRGAGGWVDPLGNVWGIPTGTDLAVAVLVVSVALWVSTWGAAVGGKRGQWLAATGLFMLALAAIAVPIMKG